MHTEVFRRKNSEVQFTLKFIEKLDGWMDERMERWINMW